MGRAYQCLHDTRQLGVLLLQQGGPDRATWVELISVCMAQDSLEYYSSNKVALTDTGSCLHSLLGGGRR